MRDTKVENIEPWDKAIIEPSITDFALPDPWPHRWRIFWHHVFTVFFFKEDTTLVYAWTFHDIHDVLRSCFIAATYFFDVVGYGACVGLSFFFPAGA